MKSNLIGISVLFMFVTACSDNPLGPTPVNTSPAVRPSTPVPNPGPGAPGGQRPTAEMLRWDVVAAGCTPRQPVPNWVLTTAPGGIATHDDDPVGVAEGEAMAIWHRPSDRSVFAKFRKQGDIYALCVWDTTDA